MLQFIFQTNTYQAVLATNGNTTYAMSLYRDINWGNRDSTVGFNAGDGVRFFMPPESFLDEGVLGLEDTSNVGPDYPGVWMFRIDQDTISQPPGTYSSWSSR